MPRPIPLLAVILALTLGAGLAPAKPKDGTNKSKKEHPIVGTVTKIDGAKILIKTRGKDAAELTILTDDKTQFQLNGKLTSIDKVKPGLEIAVNAGASASVPAQSITLLVEGKKKGKKKKTKKEAVPARVAWADVWGFPGVVIAEN